MTPSTSKTSFVVYHQRLLVLVVMFASVLCLLQSWSTTTSAAAGVGNSLLVDAFDHSSLLSLQQHHHHHGRKLSLSSSSTVSFGRSITKLETTSSSSTTTRLSMALSREEEIRRKIRQLKKEGRLSGGSGGSGDNNNSKSGTTAASSEAYDDQLYSAKVRRKLGTSKSRLLGYGQQTTESGAIEDDEMDDDEIDRVQNELDQTEEATMGMSSSTMRSGQIGTRTDLQQAQQQQQSTASYLDSLQTRPDQGNTQQQRLRIDPTLFDRSVSTEPEPPEMTEEELVQLVAEKLAEKRETEEKALAAAAKLAREKQQQQQQQEYDQTGTSTSITESTSSLSSSSSSSSSSVVENNTTLSSNTEPTETKTTTTGVGGTWTEDETAKTDLYKPKSGSWGAFPRPRDISKTYGGGRRVGVGFSNEDDAVANMKTQQLLKDYRRKVGIDVPTEKEHAAEIEEALQIGQLAMQRGIYATAVSALEKVTKWCSTNSKVGSKVYLELAMAYEAVGRTKEAYQVYKTLSDCRMEDVKFNAKRLLYGMEAMEIMRDVSSDFSRTKTRNTFIDATGLNTIAQNFDDVYNTAYIDLEGGFYKKLTESVVRSNREARQILLKATGKGEVGRTRVVQALRCISRQFDESLQSERATSNDEEPTAFLNGKPIIKGQTAKTVAAATTTTSTMRDPMAISLGDFQLLSSDEMLKNLAGRWRLQLLADKAGDGVSFFNTTMAIQEFSTEDMTFMARGPSGLVTVQSNGRIAMDESTRILSRSNIETSGVGGGAGGLMMSILFRGGTDSGFPAAVARTQQIISVDSILLITKCAPGTRSGKDAEKEHFAVWRRERVRNKDPV
ncbi:six-hairpin glycosidase-like protein [Nitzschia inconspicua]|uniref:Six-hairpin glycosidase-like protein n=1 Tax=Nitzschia inconspicua TaxID=303405 RepID=A0A9K3LTG7_9STRA|nr:six-hairpin glycosidase-like protein [Nitzschia inconspicua]